MAEDVLLTLGEYQFGMSTAAHDQLQKTKTYQWKAQQRITRDPALQYMGPGSMTVKIDGSIYPHFRGGLGQLDAMRAEADKGEALSLVDGRGNNLGKFCIKSISETEMSFVGPGIPRRIDFSMDLESYGEDANDNGGGGDGGGDNPWGWLSLFT